MENPLLEHIADEDQGVGGIKLPKGATLIKDESPEIKLPKGATLIKDEPKDVYKVTPTDPQSEGGGKKAPKPIGDMADILSSPAKSFHNGLEESGKDLKEGIKKFGDFSLKGDVSGALKIIKGIGEGAFAIGGAAIAPAFTAVEKGVEALPPLIPTPFLPTELIEPKQVLEALTQPIQSAFNRENPKFLQDHPTVESLASIGDMAIPVAVGGLIAKGKGALAEKLQKGEPIKGSEANEMVNTLKDVTAGENQQIAKQIYVDHLHEDIAPIAEKNINLHQDKNAAEQVIGKDAAEQIFAPKIAEGEQKFNEQAQNLTNKVTIEKAREVIDEHLKTVDDKIKALNPKQDAIQKPSTEGVPVRESPDNSQALGEGNAKEETAKAQEEKIDVSDEQKSTLKNKILDELKPLNLEPKELMKEFNSRYDDGIKKLQQPETPQATEEQPINTKPNESQEKGNEAEVKNEEVVSNEPASKTGSETPKEDAQKIADEHGYEHPAKMLNSIEKNTGERFMTVQDAVKSDNPKVKEFLESKKDLSEENPKSENTVGISHERLNELAKKLGLPEIPRGKVLTPKQYAEMGRALIKKGVDPNTVLESDLKSFERAAISRAYLEELKKQADEIKDKNSDEYKAIATKISDYEKNVVKTIGTEFAELGRSLQGERDLATDSFYEAEKTLKKSLGVSELTKEQTEKLQKQTEENQKLRKTIDDLEQKIKDTVDKELGDRNFIEDRNNNENETRRQKRIKVVDKFFDDAIKSVSGKGVAYSTIIPPEIIKVALKGMKEAYHAGEEISKIVEDAVKYISDKLKKDWDKDKFSKEYTDALGKLTKDLTPEEKRIAFLEKKKEDLLLGNVEEKAKAELKPTPEQKSAIDKLESEIKNLEEKSGRVAAKPTEGQIKLQKLKDKLADYKKNGIPDKNKVAKPEDSPEIQEINQQIKDLKIGKLTKDLQKQFVNKKGNSFTTKEAKSVYNYMKEKYLNNDVSWDDSIKYAAGDLGMTPEQMRHAIISPKTEPISIEKWKKMSDLRKNRNSTKRYIDEQSRSPLLIQAKKVSGDIRDVATFGHGHVFLGTHAGLTAFSNPHLWSKAYLKGVDLAYKMSDAEVEQFTHDFENRPLWAVFNKAGLQNDLFKMGNDMEIASESHFLDLSRKLHSKGGVTGKVGKVLVLGSEAGRKGFMAIKWLRQELAEQAYNNLTEEEKNNPQVLESIAQLMNNATGSTNVKLQGGVNEVIKEGLFAGGMEISRWEKIFKNPAKSLSTLSKIPFEKIGWIKELPPEERVFATIWAKRVMTQALVYGGLVAVSKAIFHKDDETPLQSMKKSIGTSEMLKMNVGKDRIFDPTSGMATSISLLGKVYKALPSKEKGGNVSNVLMDYGRKKLAPTYQTGAEVVTGHDALGNVVPFRDVKPEHKYNKKLSAKEYAESKLMLPLAEGFQQANESHNIGSGIVGGLISGMFGFKSYSKEKGQVSPTPAKPLTPAEQKAKDKAEEMNKKAKKASDSMKSRVQQKRDKK